MKHFLSLFVLSIFFTLQLNAQEVPEIQRPLITKIAATWCPPCGSWAWDLFEDVVVDNQEKAVLIVAHHSGDLVNDVAKDFSSNLNAPYQPYIYFNNEDQDATSSNTDVKRTEIEEKTNNANISNPIANAGMNLTLNGNELNVDTRTLFFQAAEGEYYLGVYFVENEVINFQASQGNDAVHEKILRGAISEGSFGELLTNGNVESGTEFTHNFTSTINSNWNIDHLEVITIIWQKVDDKFLVVNSNISTDFQTPSALKTWTIENATINFAPTIMQNNTLVSININNDIQHARIDITDIKGAVVRTIYEGNLSTGVHQYQIDQSDLIGQGNYFVVLRNNNKVVAKPFIFKQ